MEKKKVNIREVVAKYKTNDDRICEMMRKGLFTTADRMEVRRLEVENKLYLKKIRADGEAFLRENPNVDDEVRVWVEALTSHLKGFGEYQDK